MHRQGKQIIAECNATCRSARSCGGLCTTANIYLIALQYLFYATCKRSCQNFVRSMPCVYQDLAVARTVAQLTRYAYVRSRCPTTWGRDDKYPRSSVKSCFRVTSTFSASSSINRLTKISILPPHSTYHYHTKSFAQLRTELPKYEK